MANIKRIEGKTGVSFQITVTQGRDINGKQVRHYRTWKPEGKMTERQMQKAVERAAADFEREIEQGYQTRQSPDVFLLCPLRHRPQKKRGHQRADAFTL